MQTIKREFDFWGRSPRDSERKCQEPNTDVISNVNICPSQSQKPLKMDLRSKSAPIMKQTESVFYDWLAGRHKAAAEKKSCSGVGCQRLWTTSSHHRTTPSTRGSHSTLFFFCCSVESKLRLGRRRREKSIRGNCYMQVNKDMDVAFLTDGWLPSKINNAKHSVFFFFFK